MLRKQKRNKLPTTTNYSSDSSILLPFDSDLVFLNIELHYCFSKTNDA